MPSLPSLFALCSAAALFAVCLGSHKKINGEVNLNSTPGAEASQLVSAALREYMALVEDRAMQLRSTINEKLHSHFLDRLSGEGKNEEDDKTVKEMVESLKEDISLTTERQLRFDVTAVAGRLEEANWRPRRRVSKNSRPSSEEEEDEESAPSTPAEVRMQSTSILESLSSFVDEFVSNAIVTFILDPVLEGFLDIAELFGLEDSAEVAVLRGVFAGCSTLIRNGREATQ